MIIIEGVNHISFSVSSLEKSLEFYRDIFYFDTVEKKPEQGEAFLLIGDIRLRLKETKGEYESPASSYVCFNIDMQDFDDALDELEDKGIAYEESDTEDGRRIFLADPDGNRLAICYVE